MSDNRLMQDIQQLQDWAMTAIEDDKHKRLVMQSLVREARNDLLKGRETRALASTLTVLDMMLTTTTPELPQ